MDLEFTGKVTAFFDKSGEKDGKAYTSFQAKIEEQDSAYTDSILIEGFGDKIKVPKEGDIVTVYFHPKVKEWNGKLYGSNNAWRIVVNESAPVDDNAPISGNQNIPTSDSDGLPF